jgi:hypothetical protein
VSGFTLERRHDLIELGDQCVQAVDVHTLQALPNL